MKSWVPWVFSGVGVALLGVLGRFLGRWFRREGQSAGLSASRSNVTGSPVASGSNITQTVNFMTVTAPTASLAPAEGDYSETPTPADIETHLDSLPAFQRDRVKDSYVGLKVSWPAQLRSLFEKAPTYRRLTGSDVTHTLFARYKQARGPSILADIDIERFPRLKIAHDGTPLRISGTISAVSVSGTVTLRDAEIKFE